MRTFIDSIWFPIVILIVTAMVFFLFWAGGLQAQTLEHIAGGPDARGNGGPARQGVIDPAGSMFVNGEIVVADVNGNEIRQLTVGGTITAIAGTGFQGFGGDNGPATQATLGAPSDVARAPDGTIYILDGLNSRLRWIDTGGIMHTLMNAPLQTPSGMALHSESGGLFAYVANTSRFDVVKIGPLPCLSACSAIVVAGQNGVLTHELPTDGQGHPTGAPPDNLGDGGPATSATFKHPTDVYFDPSDPLSFYVSDADGGRIRKITNGIIETVAGGAISTTGIFGDGGLATSAQVGPSQIAVLEGTIYLADKLSNRIRRIDATTHIITTIMGTGKSNTEKIFSSDPLQQAMGTPSSIAINEDGSALVVGSATEKILYVLYLNQPHPTLTQVAMTPTIEFSPSTAPTVTATITLTSTRTATDTPAVPTRTRTAVPTPTGTWTRLPLSTATASATETINPFPVDTWTHTPIPTSTATGTATETPNGVLICDVTGDWTVSSLDAAWVLQYVAGLRNFSSKQKIAADASGDGSISALDATRILQFVVGLRPPNVPANQCGKMVMP